MTGEPYPEPSTELEQVAGGGAGPPPVRRWRRGWGVLAVLAAVAVGATLVVAGFVLREPGHTSDQRDEPTALQQAKDRCAPHTAAVRVGDEGRSLEVARVVAEEREGASWNELSCVLSRTNVPDAVIAHIENTRALDGRQEAEWGPFTASWTYHPSSGLNLIMRERTS